MSSHRIERREDSKNFRQVSGDGTNFGWSMEQGGVLAFSRIHADEEMVVSCIPNPFRGFSGFVEIDPNLAMNGDRWKVVFSSLGTGGSGVTRTFSQVPLRRSVEVSLASTEVLVLARA